MGRSRAHSSVSKAPAGHLQQHCPYQEPTRHRVGSDCATSHSIYSGSEQQILNQKSHQPSCSHQCS